MREIWAIALNTFREAVRNRIFAGLILFSIALLLLTLAVSSASLHEEARVMKNMGLFLISTFSVLISVYVGSSLVYKEIERKTVFTIMPKPIFRFQFLVGKYLGLAGTMFIQLAVMTLVFRGQFLLLDERFGLELFQALMLVYVEVLVVTAIAMLFSSFSTPFLSGLLTVGCFILGRFSDRLVDLRFPAQAGEAPSGVLEAVATGVRGVATVLPDLTLYNKTEEVVHELYVSWPSVGYATLHGLTYVAILLLIACFLFSRRDFV